MSVIIPAVSYPPNTKNVNPASVFNKYRLALAKTRAGISDTRVICYGDSTFAGVGSSTNATIPATKSMPTQLAALLNTTATPACVSLGVPLTILSGGTDNRWALGTGWTHFSGGFGAGSGAAYNATGVTAGALVYTASPQVTCDGFYVYWLGNSGLGTIQCTATGGTPTSINCSGAGGTYRTLVSAGSASATNTLSITQPTTTANVFIVGVEPVLSTKKQVLVGNAGVGGAQAAGWALTGTFGGIAFIGATAPDLAIISLGINDAANAISPSAFQASLQSVITAAQVTGDVLLTDFPQTNLASTTTAAYNAEKSYLPIYAQLAAANNCAYLSFNARLGGVGSNAGYMGSDGVHPYDTGYFDWAAFIANVIGSP